MVLGGWGWQLAKHLPSNRLDEIQGMCEGAAAAGSSKACTCIKRGMTVAAIATGDVEKVRCVPETNKGK